jgi:hypothetical protein
VASVPAVSQSASVPLSVSPSTIPSATSSSIPQSIVSQQSPSKSTFSFHPSITISSLNQFILMPFLFHAYFRVASLAMSVTRLAISLFQFI